MTRNTTGLHANPKLQRAREQASRRKLATGGPVVPSSYGTEAAPVDFARPVNPGVPLISAADIAALYHPGAKAPPNLIGLLASTLSSSAAPRPAYEPSQFQPLKQLAASDMPVTTTLDSAAGEGSGGAAGGGNDQSDNPGNSEGVTNDGTRTDPSSWGTDRDPYKDVYNAARDFVNTGMTMAAPGGMLAAAAINAASGLIDANRANPNLTDAEKAKAAAVGALGRLGSWLGLTDKAPPAVAPPGDGWGSISPDDTSGGPSAWGGERTATDPGRQGSISPDDTSGGPSAWGGDRTEGNPSASPDSTESGGGNTGGEGKEGREGREGTETAGGEGGDSGNARTGGLVARHTFSGVLKGPGTPTSDSIATRLAEGGKGPMVSRDEFVVNARTVQRFGPDFFYGLQQLAKQPSVTPEEIRALFQETKMGFPTEGQSRYQGINRTRLPPTERASIVPLAAPPAITVGPIGAVAGRAPVIAVPDRNPMQPVALPMRRPQIGQPSITADDLKTLFAGGGGPGLAGPRPRVPMPPHLAGGGYIRRHLDDGGTVGVAANPAAAGPSIYSQAWDYTNGNKDAFSGGANPSGMASPGGVPTYTTPEMGNLVAAELGGGSLPLINTLANQAGLQVPIGGDKGTSNAGYTPGGGGIAGTPNPSTLPPPTPSPQSALPPSGGLSSDQVSSMITQAIQQALATQKASTQNNAVAGSFIDPTTGATVTQQGPAQGAIQVLNALSPARGNRFASEYAAPTFWG